ncbi:hypothetical protein PoB_000639600 [Plakobranchus ocellatus]|uniref:Uncharacterized protein n=1 Tax=Plakobranchus ocellatus TaxID=259542 RepID=A0AAV3Y9I0_9GAST|nr:hypothetical protein PoB_000639600 [Plakobranchus ocellatus]
MKQLMCRYSSSVMALDTEGLIAVIQPENVNRIQLIRATERLNLSQHPVNTRLGFSFRGFVWVKTSILQNLKSVWSVAMVTVTRVALRLSLRYNYVPNSMNRARENQGPVVVHQAYYSSPCSRALSLEDVSAFFFVPAQWLSKSTISSSF